MFIDGRTIPDSTALDFDICIMGAGAAGITLAREFNGHNFRVGIIESGDVGYDEDTQSLYEGDSVGIPYFPLNSARLRYLGGTTNHWGGYCYPMTDFDLEARDWIPYSGWPLSSSDLAPYYERAQKVCQIPTPDWDLESWKLRDRASPLGFNGARVVNRFSLIIPEPFLRFNRNYREELRRAENLTLLLNANVTEIEANDSASAVSVLHVACLSGTKFSVTAKIFILALGGIENPRLLLLSNKIQSAGLGNGEDLVGRFFMEHPRFDAGLIVPQTPQIQTRFYQQHTVGDTDLIGYIGLSDDTMREEKLAGVIARITPIYDPAFERALASPELTALKEVIEGAKHRRLPDQFGTHLANILEDLSTWKADFIPSAPVQTPKPSAIEKIINAGPGGMRQAIAEMLGDIANVAHTTLADKRPVEQLVVTTRVDQVPNPESRVSLAPERDRLGQNRVQLDWRLSPIDKHSARRMLDILGAELGQSGIGRLQSQLDEDNFTVPPDTHGGYHHIGTTRMAVNPKEGVVDENCRVYDISNLFVAGSSVFPTAGSGTPTLTLVALALRLADHIKKEFQ